MTTVATRFGRREWLLVLGEESGCSFWEKRVAARFGRREWLLVLGEESGYSFWEKRVATRFGRREFSVSRLTPFPDF